MDGIARNALYREADSIQKRYETETDCRVICDQEHQSAKTDKKKQLHGYNTELKKKSPTKPKDECAGQ